jgi:hypothetical protein
MNHSQRLGASFNLDGRPIEPAARHCKVCQSAHRFEHRGSANRRVEHECHHWNKGDAEFTEGNMLHGEEHTSAAADSSANVREG